ncbi:MAG: trypsin-like peptidase domain-containing protein [Oscillospiraceae bacterium]|nr:trypsin-like peptidase domain-containing protein [Oscillospiraceae bacterium]
MAAALLTPRVSALRYGAGAASDAAGAFEPVRRREDAEFTDVDPDAWYAQYVETAYEYGLMDGKTGTVFDPGGAMTAAEAIKLAATLHMIYHGKSLGFEPATPWHGAYTDAAIRWGVAEPLVSYTAPATRALLAELIGGALPSGEYAPINAVGDYRIPDVSPDERFGPSVYTLYRAGVLTGGNGYGLFRPDVVVTRAQAAAIAVRAAIPEYRARLSQPERLSAGEIYSLCSGAVMQLDTYDAVGTHIRTGSAFFISPSGLAVTCLHVLEYSERATATLADGSQREIAEVVARDAEADIAVVRVEGEGYDCLKLARSETLKPGARAYVISNQLGLINSITEGLVSQPLREVEERNFVQFTAHISFGSGGAPLIDEHGFAVGIVSGSFAAGQSLNLAVPSEAAFPLLPRMYGAV